MSARGSNNKRGRAISGQLRSISDLSRLGLISAAQKGTLKQWVVEGDRRADEALRRLDSLSTDMAKVSLSSDRPTFWHKGAARLRMDNDFGVDGVDGLAFSSDARGDAMAGGSAGAAGGARSTSLKVMQDDDMMFEGLGDADMMMFDDFAAGGDPGLAQFFDATSPGVGGLGDILEENGGGGGGAGGGGGRGGGGGGARAFGAPLSDLGAVEGFLAPYPPLDVPLTSTSVGGGISSFSSGLEQIVRPSALLASSSSLSSSSMSSFSSANASAAAASAAVAPFTTARGPAKPKPKSKPKSKPKPKPKPKKSKAGKKAAGATKGGPTRNVLARVDSKATMGHGSALTLNLSRALSVGSTTSRDSPNGSVNQRHMLQGMSNDSFAAALHTLGDTTTRVPSSDTSIGKRDLLQAANEASRGLSIGSIGSLAYSRSSSRNNSTEDGVNISRNRSSSSLLEGGRRGRRRSRRRMSKRQIAQAKADEALFSSDDTLSLLESLTQAMRHPSQGIEVRDRRYRLTKYKDCFIGSEMVDWLVNCVPTLGGDRAAAVELGHKMVRTGFVSHVTRAHGLKDKFLFYRFEEPPGFWKVDLDELMVRVSGGAAAGSATPKSKVDQAAKGERHGKGRAYMPDESAGFELAERVSGDGLVYANCFVASEAVSWCAAHVSELAGSRAGAVRLMKRLMRAGYIEHVGLQPIFEDVDVMLFCFCSRRTSAEAQIDLIADHMKRMEHLKALQKKLELELQQQQTRNF